MDDWLTDQVSHSYLAALRAEDRSDLLLRLRAILDAEFAGGVMTVPYETWLWIATAV